MKDYIISETTGRKYAVQDVVRILNPKQQLLYIKSGLYPLDLYVSIDNKTNKDILVMLFSREESYPLYQKWCDHELR
jgi:hypothetical protein